MLIAVNGIELWVETHGASTGVPVLMLSGSDSSTLRWPATLVDPLVAAGAQVIAFDHRDSGASTKIDPDRPYTLDALADDAGAVLDALGINTAHIVGYSMGGAVAQILALRMPRRVRTLSLLSSTPGLGDGSLPFADEWFVERMAERMFTPPPTGQHERIAWIVELYRMLAGTRYPFDEEGHHRLAKAEIERSWYPESGHGIASGASPSRVDSLESISTPTLIVHGTCDPVYPVEHAKALAWGIPNATLELVDGLGHEVPAAFGAELAALLLQFWAACRA